jgi:hypothetical protein
LAIDAENDEDIFDIEEDNDPDRVLIEADKDEVALLSSLNNIIFSSLPN